MQGLEDDAGQPGLLLGLISLSQGLALHRTALCVRAGIQIQFPVLVEQALSSTGPSPHTPCLL